jgi:hypothetical protein
MAASTRLHPYACTIIDNLPPEFETHTTDLKELFLAKLNRSFEPTELESIAQYLLAAYPDLTSKRGRLYTQTSHGSHLEQLTTSIFNQSWQHNPKAVVDAFRLNFREETLPYPVWKQQLCIQIPQITARICNSPLTKIIATIGTVYVAWSLSWSTYTYFSYIIPARVIPWAINNVPIQAFKLYNTITKITQFIYNQAFDALLGYGALCCLFSYMLPPIPYVSYVFSFKNLNTALHVFQIIIFRGPSMLGSVTSLITSNWDLGIRTCNYLKTRLTKIAESNQTAFINSSKDKTKQVWLSLVSQNAA